MTELKDWELAPEEITEIEHDAHDICRRCEGEGRLWADGLPHYYSATRETKACPDCDGDGRVVSGDEGRAIATAAVKKVVEFALRGPHMVATGNDGLDKCWDCGESSTDNGPFYAVAAWFDENGIHTPKLPPLYNTDGTVNWNMWMKEGVPALEAKDVVVLLHMGYIDDVGAYSWELYERDECEALAVNPDPWAATVEYLEAK